jgi:Tfp pilus assembly protein PilE
VILMVLAAIGLCAVMFVGIVAAIAVPRFNMAAARAREIPGRLLLQRAYHAEHAYHAQHERYTSDPAELATARAAAEVSGEGEYHLEVSAASDRELCLEAVPARGSKAKPLSVDVEANLYRSAGCSGLPDPTFYANRTAGREPIPSPP